MSSYFPHSFGGDSPAAAETHSFDHDYVPQSFDSIAADSSPPIYGEDLHSDASYFSSETNDIPILPPPEDMVPEEGYALREWRRQNAIRLEEKEQREKDLLSQIIVEADEYKVEFHRKRQITCETKIKTNREKERVFIAAQKRFHAEADQDYWKSIAELIPKEVPTIEKRKGKKEQEKKASVVVVQGPKPGKATDLSRMRQILNNLKKNTPTHLKPSPPASEASTSAVSTEVVAAA